MPFQFTSNIYTNEKRQVIPPINELIIGIACTLEYPEHYANLVYAGNRDEEDDVMTFALDTEYINQLRHSPEYHDAVMDYLTNTPAYRAFRSLNHRIANKVDWHNLMREYGVLGTISLDTSIRPWENN